MIMESQKIGGIGFPMVRYRTQSKENDFRSLYVSCDCYSILFINCYKVILIIRCFLYYFKYFISHP